MSRLTMDYIAFLDYLAGYLQNLLNDPPLELGVTVARDEPKVADFTYVMVGYPEKTEERIKAGISTDIYLDVPLKICTNELTIEASRELAWNILRDMEGEIREDFKLGAYPTLQVATPKDASGEDYAGREYRLNATLECYFFKVT